MMSEAKRRRYLPSIAVAFASMSLAAVIAFTVVKLSVRADDQREAAAAIAASKAQEATSRAFWARYDADIASCRRGDVVRTILHEFLAGAEKARRSPPLEPGDLEAAKLYAELEARIWPLKKCTDLIPAPNVPRPKGTP